MDWEYSDYRSIMYDYLVMFLKSRVMNGLSDRYDQLRINIEGEEKTNNWLESFLKKKVP